MGKINFDYVLGIVQKDNRLDIIQEKISSSSLLLRELKDMITNEDKTVMDMQKHYDLNIQSIQKSFGYILPYYYDATYVYGISEPRISDNEYQKALNDRISQITTGIYNDKKKSANKAMKRSRYEAYERFLTCYNYYLACKKFKENYDWKMLSSESIGWTNYEYPIDKDFVVYVSTNFGYGWSSYFDLTVKYKDVVIAPYTHLIKYYKANMVQICNCTRSYTVNRENWAVAFDFVKDFVNHGKENPTAFAKEYIMNEVHELVNGMVRIMQQPVSEVQKQINNIGRYSSDFGHMTWISEMPDEDRKYFELNRSEFGVVYKSEKISCGLDVLESMKSLVPILPEVESCIEKIKNLNYKLIPEITSLSNSIGVEVERLKTDIENYKKQLKDAETEKEPFSTQFSEEWKVLYNSNPSTSSCAVFEKEFKARYPRYSELCDKTVDLRNKISQADEKRLSRAVIKQRLDECLTKINDYFAEVA